MTRESAVSNGLNTQEITGSSLALLNTEKINIAPSSKFESTVAPRVLALNSKKNMMRGKNSPNKGGEESHSLGRNAVKELEVIYENDFVT